MSYAVEIQLEDEALHVVTEALSPEHAREKIEQTWLGWDVVDVQEYDPAAVVAAMLAQGGERQERGRLAAQMLQVGHEVQTMAAGKEPDGLQAQARMYLQETNVLTVARAWGGDLEDGWVIVQRLRQFHRDLMAAGHGAPGIRPL